MVDLLAELQALETAPRVMLAAVRRLEAMGVPRDFALALVGNGDLHLAPVEQRPRSGLFEFGGPDRRLILAVWHGPASSSGAVGQIGDQLIDLVALASHDENQWALRLGIADVLGMDVLEHAIATEAREVRLYATPMDWLRAGGAGVCVLDWNRQALGALRGLRPTQTIVVVPPAQAAAGGSRQAISAKDKLKGLLAYGGLPLVAEDRTQLRKVASGARAPVQHADRR